MTIGERIKVYRLTKGWSQEELAKRAELNRNSIYRYEKNETMPRMPQMKRLAVALGIAHEKLANSEYDELLTAALEYSEKVSDEAANTYIPEMTKILQEREVQIYEAGKTAGQEEYVYQKIYFASDAEEKRERYALLHQKFKSGIITDKEKDELIELSHFFASALSDLQETANQLSDLSTISENMEFVKNATPDVQATPTVQDFLKLLLGIDEKNAVNFISEFGNLMRDMPYEQKEETAKNMINKLTEFKNEAEKILNIKK